MSAEMTVVADGKISDDHQSDSASEPIADGVGNMATTMMTPEIAPKIGAGLIARLRVTRTLIAASPPLVPYPPVRPFTARQIAHRKWLFHAIATAKVPTMADFQAYYSQAQVAKKNKTVAPAAARQPRSRSRRTHAQTGKSAAVSTSDGDAGGDGEPDGRIASRLQAIGEPRPAAASWPPLDDGKRALLDDIASFIVDLYATGAMP